MRTAASAQLGLGLVECPRLSGNVPGTIRAYVVPCGGGAANERAGTGDEAHGPPLPLEASPVSAAALAVLVVLLAGASVPLYAAAHQNVLANGGENIALAVIFGSVGLVVARRQPRNAIGWLMLAGPALELLSIDGTVYAEFSYRPGYHLAFGVVGVLLNSSWVVGDGALALVILLFPDGALPSPRWRWVLRSYLAVASCYTAITYANVLSTPGHDVRIDSSGTLTPDLAGWFGTVTRLSGTVFAAFWLSFVAAQVLSWRHSSGERRQQLKWLMSGAAALAVSQAIDQVSIVIDPNPSAWANAMLNLITGLGLAALPVSIGVAILRYRLYEIDRIISRTLAYAIVTGLLVSVYGGLVLLATHVLGLFFSGGGGGCHAGGGRVVQSATAVGAAGGGSTVQPGTI